MLTELQLRWLLACQRNIEAPTDADLEHTDAILDALDECLERSEAAAARQRRVEALEARVAAAPEAATVRATGEGVHTARHDLDDPYRANPATLTETSARDAAFVALERSEKQWGLKSIQMDHADRLLRHSDPGGFIARHMLATGADDYVNGWAKVMTDNEVMLEDSERRAVQQSRSLTLTTNQGGYAIPFMLDPTIVITNDGYIDPFRSISRVESINVDTWHGLTSDGVTAGWGAEGTEVGDNSPTLAQPSVPVHKAHVFVPFTLEIGGDWPNIAQAVGSMIAESKGALEAIAFATGSGNGQPTGIITALDANTNSEVAVASNNALAVGDIFNLVTQVPPRWRPQAVWVMHLYYLNAIRQFGTANNAYAFTVDLTPEGFPSLLGHRVIEASTTDAAIGTGTDNAIVFGDFRNYLILDRVGLSVELVPHLFGTTNNRPIGMRGWYGWWRTGADSINDKAFRLLQV